MNAIVIFYECGHVYANARGFVSIHAYVPSEPTARMLAEFLDGSFRRHGAIYDVYVTNRQAIAIAATKLLAYPDPDKLVLVSRLQWAFIYGSNPSRRSDAVAHLRGVTSSVPSLASQS